MSKQGLIYEIVCNETNERYIGSTFEPTVARRMTVHRCHSNKCISNQIIGRGNYFYGLLETVIVNSRDELRMKEREWFDKLPNINKYKPYATKEETIEHNKEYCEQNKDKIKEYKKEYYEQNIDKIKEYKKEYYEQNKEYFEQYRKEYHEQNKDKLEEYQKKYREQNKDKLKDKRKEYYQRKKMIKNIVK